MFGPITRMSVYSKFIPVRKKNTKTPDVFAFRIMAGTIGAFAITEAIRNANSIAFIGGVPAYERYFLGSENDLRGYESRSIGPIAPFDTYVTTRNVVAATNAAGTPVPIAGFPVNSPIPAEIASHRPAYRVSRVRTRPYSREISGSLAAIRKCSVISNTAFRFLARQHLPSSRMLVRYSI